jgi:lipoprotein-releasing system permease protein
MEIAEVLFVVIASILAAMVSTFFPALWASKLEPVEALRYE